jgi:tetratricopeptide (TPR) repeat protein
MDKAIASLEAVARENPLYEDTLTLLGRAYYRRERFQDAFQILQRAVKINQNDEIAWVALGLTQLRLGLNNDGLESLKGGLTLLSRAMKDGYKGYQLWDYQGTVRGALRRSALLAAKGLEAKNDLIRTTELLLTRIDDEEWKSRTFEGMRYPD